MQVIYSMIMRPSLNQKDAFDYVKNEYKKNSFDEEFSIEIIKRVFEKKEELDKCISDFAEDKTINRIDPISLSALYIGATELLFLKNKQASAIIINEAIELAKEYGKDTSFALVNAILSKMEKSLVKK